MNDAYALPLPGLISSHDPFGSLLFGDHDSSHNPKLDALAHSGDYFITLATELENLASELTEISPAATSLALARLADDLMYMQQRYHVLRKTHPDKSSELERL